MTVKYCYGNKYSDRCEYKWQWHTSSFSARCQSYSVLSVTHSKVTVRDVNSGTGSFNYIWSDCEIQVFSIYIIQQWPVLYMQVSDSDILKVSVTWRIKVPVTYSVSYIYSRSSASDINKREYMTKISYRKKWQWHLFKIKETYSYPINWPVTSHAYNPHIYNTIHVLLKYKTKI